MWKLFIAFMLSALVLSTASQAQEKTPDELREELEQTKKGLRLFEKKLLEVKPKFENKNYQNKYPLGLHQDEEQRQLLSPPANEPSMTLQNLNELALDGLGAYVESLKQPVHKNEDEVAQLSEHLKTLELTVEILSFDGMTVPVPKELEKWASRMVSMRVQWSSKSKEWNPTTAFEIIGEYLMFGEPLSSEGIQSPLRADTTRSRLTKSAEGKKGKDAALAVATEAMATATEVCKAKTNQIHASNKHIADLKAKAQEIRKRYTPDRFGPSSENENRLR